MLKSSLQIKVAATFVVFMAIMAGLFFVYQQTILIPVYSALERAFVARELERVMKVFHHEQMGLAALAADWSAWDDTYEYAIDRNSTYEDGNLSLSSLTNLSVNLIFLYDKTGAVLWGGVSEPGEETWSSLAEFPPQGPSHIPGLSAFPDVPAGKQLRAGLVFTGKGLLMLASLPILNSHAQGDPHGVFVMGRLLKGENLEKLQTVAGLDFEVLPAAQLPTDHKALALTQPKTQENAMYIDDQDLNTLVAWRAMHDLYDQPRFLVKVTIARDIFRTGYQGLRNGVWLMIGAMLILMAGLMVVVQREVVRPVVRISQHLLRLRLKGVYDQPINYTARDELGRLARSLNALLLKVAEQSNQLKDLSYEDSLTAVANRRCFDEQFQHQWIHCVTEKLPLAVILCDIDDFKRYNDLYGHLQGDKCLHDVAQTLKRAANKQKDLVARFGGEEFVILLPETTLLDAIAVAERICTTVEALHIEHGHSHVSRWVTVSLGVAAVTPSNDLSSEVLLHAADNALYRAKTAGRNRVASGAISSGLF